jgi:hypothetical protein
MGPSCVSDVEMKRRPSGKRSGSRFSPEYVQPQCRGLVFTFLTSFEVLLDCFHERHIGG